MRLSSAGHCHPLGYFLLIFSLLLLTACGGGGGGDGPDEEPAPPSGDSVTISGSATYDFVPVTNQGLNYSATTARPIRGAVVEALNASGALLATTATDAQGSYSLSVAANTSVRIRVKAQLNRTQTPTWDMKVTDNTNANRLYALDGNLSNSGSSNSQRNLHAPSGWSGNAYSATRAAAPFAILDSIYTGLQRFTNAGNNLNFPPLELRWSVNNNSASNPDFDFTQGEIGTSFFYEDAIYILGEANTDTDEYDHHVILHEWGHYIEATLSRADSIGGEHAYEDLMDMRVAFSEGFGNAFSAMMLDDPIYRDSGRNLQASVFEMDVRDGPADNNPGWYREASIQSILYNYYASGDNKTARDFAPILNTLTSSEFYDAESLVSIFLFAERLLALFPGHSGLFESLLNGQDINSTHQYGVGETNSGGYSASLPIYKTLFADANPVNVCSSSTFGKGNKLGNSQFLRFQINQAGNYTLRIDKFGGDAVSADPDFIVYQRGTEVVAGREEAPNLELQVINLSPGNYVLEVYDWNNIDTQNQAANTTCFNVTLGN